MKIDEKSGFLEVYEAYGKMYDFFNNDDMISKNIYWESLRKYKLEFIKQAFVDDLNYKRERKRKKFPSVVELDYFARNAAHKAMKEIPSFSKNYIYCLYCGTRIFPNRIRCDCGVEIKKEFVVKDKMSKDFIGSWRHKELINTFKRNEQWIKEGKAKNHRECLLVFLEEKGLNKYKKIFEKIGVIKDDAAIQKRELVENRNRPGCKRSHSVL